MPVKSAASSPGLQRGITLDIESKTATWPFFCYLNGRCDDSVRSTDPAVTEDSTISATSPARHSDSLQLRVAWCNYSELSTTVALAEFAFTESIPFCAAAFDL
jgi:hypothetical protein